jgi:2-amino-4-hydroxy-6-hydroxymethyldihydropteridine diphosphokinase
MAAAADRLGSLGRVVSRSSLYSTEPVGFAAQPRFVNAVVQLETELEPQQLLDGLLRIEHEFGRDRAASVPNGPRTLDLDILLLGDLTVNEPELDIPHPRLADRAFVLIPLAQIAPLLLVPGHHKTVVQLLRNLPANPESKSDASDAVVPFEDDSWSAGACRGGA